MTIEFMNLSPSGFKKEEAITFLNFEVTKKNESKKGKSIVETNGFVIGLLVINDEIELVVQWYEGLMQYTKAEFLNQIEVVDG